jgi:hypothetical protein
MTPGLGAPSGEQTPDFQRAQDGLTLIRMQHYRAPHGDYCKCPSCDALRATELALRTAEERLALLTQQLAFAQAKVAPVERHVLDGFGERITELEAENAQLRNEGKSLAQWIGTLFTSFNTSTPEGVRAGVESLRSEVAGLSAVNEAVESANRSITTQRDESWIEIVRLRNKIEKLENEIPSDVSQPLPFEEGPDDD